MTKKLDVKIHVMQRRIWFSLKSNGETNSYWRLKYLKRNMGLLKLYLGFSLANGYLVEMVIL